MNLVKPGINIDFVGQRKKAGVVSLLMVFVSLTLFFVVGPNWGIDFTGGTEVVLKFTESVQIGEVRNALTELGLSDDAVQQIGSDSEHEYTIRIQDPEFGVAEMRTELDAALERSFGADWVEEAIFNTDGVIPRLKVKYTGSPVIVSAVQTAIAGVPGAKAKQSLDDNTVYVELEGLSTRIKGILEASLGGRDFEVRKVDSVGPKVGGELRQQGFIALVATLALILVYVGFRFDLNFAPGAILALIHDVSIVVGIFTITRHEFNLPMIGALLTIIGYSLNDTIVIYDRIRENVERYRRKDMSDLINTSINETLARTLATSITTAAAMLAFLILGGPVIETFALAILLGVIFGTYSTIYVASPTILLMSDLRPHIERLFTPRAVAAAEEAATEGQTSTERRRMEREANQDSGA
jgi:preprotein translocase subunit SecF